MHSARTLAVRAAALTPAPMPAASTTAATAAGAGSSLELSAARPRLRGAQVQWHPGAVQVSVGAHVCSGRRVSLLQNTGQHERHRWAVCQLRVECHVVPLSRERLRLEAPIHQPTHAVHHVGLCVPGQGDELLAFGDLARPPQQTNGKLRAAVAGRDTADGIGGGCIGGKLQLITDLLSSPACRKDGSKQHVNTIAGAMQTSSISTQSSLPFAKVDLHRIPAAFSA